ncbi:hypothetical protein MBLNU13_g07000t2 [Cladosporium sp. NU13]
MALREAEFVSAIDELSAQWQKAFTGVDGLHTHGDWEDVRVLERYGTRYLRITRRIVDNSRAKQASHNSQASEDEVAIPDEDDSEALVTPVGTRDCSRAVQCDIVYSPAYQVPVLYLTFAERSTRKTIALPSPDEFYKALVPDDFKSPMRSIGVMGALSMAEHPITGTPAYFVHPCRTQEAMSPLLENAGPKAEPCSATQYLLLWFGVIGASVGLSVPISVAKLFADRSDDAAAELGKC